jgi:aspartate dehydrogenase
MTIKVGVIGCGVIGSEICKILDGSIQNMELVGVYDVDLEKAEDIHYELKMKPEVAEDIDHLIEMSDLIVEAASPKAVALVGKKAIEKKKDLMIMSVGGLIENIALINLAKEKGTNIFLPSGAICGLDGVKSASIGKIESVTITTTKPPQGLEGAPYVVHHHIDLNVKEKTTIFEGTASEAVQAFPKNINVSATLSIAGIGAENTKVKIVCDPKSHANTHEIEVVGEFGMLHTKTQNFPSPNNPKTSYLAVLSAVAKLKEIAGSVKIG